MTEATSPRSRKMHEGLLMLGTAAPKRPVHELTAAICDEDVEPLAALFRRHKVMRLAAAALADAEHAPAVALRERLEALHRPADERRAHIATVLAELEAAAAELGFPIALMKGAVAYRWYRDELARTIGDVDAFVSHEHEGWRLARWLVRHGYAYDRNELPWFKQHDDGYIYGQIRVERWIGDVRLRCDVHFGAYSVRHCGAIDLDVPARDGVAPLATDQNLVATTVNAAGDYFITIKDLNDVYLGSRRDDLDWDAFRRRIRDADLAPFWNVLVDRLRQFLALDDAHVAELEATRVTTRRERAPDLFDENARARCLVTTQHAFSVGRRRSMGRALVDAATAVRYYARPLTLRAGRPLLRRRARFPEPRMRTCVRLVPPDTAAALLGRDANPPANGGGVAGERPVGSSPVMRIVATADGDLLRVEDDVFVPTVYYRLPEPLVARASSLAEHAGAAS